MMLIEDLFEMGSGFVLDFSDRTFASFFASDVGQDIYSPAYAKDGTSKAKRLRCFLRAVDAKTAVRALEALWGYRQASLQRRGQPDAVSQSRPRFDALLQRLDGRERVASPASPPESAAQLSIEVAAELKRELLALSGLTPQLRGFAFGRFLKRLFESHGLEARDAFRLRGEQIDGSFVIGNETYLLEAKWQSNPVGNSELHVFHGKIEQKAAWARGLFVSESGFSPDGLHAFGRGKRVVCMDGFDIFEALERRLSITTVIERKVRYAAESGEVFVRVRDLFR